MHIFPSAVSIRPKRLRASVIPTHEDETEAGCAGLVLALTDVSEARHGFYYRADITMGISCLSRNNLPVCC